MLIILDRLSGESRRTLVPFLHRRLDGDLVEDMVDEGLRRLDRLASIVDEDEEGALPVILQGWVFSPDLLFPVINSKFVLRATALSRLAARHGAVRVAPSASWSLRASNPFHDLEVAMDAILPPIHEGTPTETLKRVLSASAPSPKVVLVGEGPSRFTWRGLPFSGGQSAQLLHEALRGVTVPLYVINARGGLGEEPPREELHVLAARRPAPLFVALGRVAADWLAQEGVAHTYLEHPAHCLRFKRSKTEAWIELLRSVLRS